MEVFDKRAVHLHLLNSNHISAINFRRRLIFFIGVCNEFIKENKIELEKKKDMLYPVFLRKSLETVDFDYE